MAMFRCAWAAAVVVASLSGCAEDASLEVARAGDGHDAWTIIECADFDFDGLADVLWYSPTRNVMSVWRMDGTRLLAPGPMIPGPSGQHWRAVPIEEESADFNRDGMADVLWHNPATNLVAAWLMDGDAVLEKGNEVSGPPDVLGWDLGAVGDFDGDGMSGILWHNARTSSAVIWTVRGTGIAARGQIFAAPDGPGWVPIIGADYNGDMLSDVLWFNASRNTIAVWLISGTHVLERGQEISGPPGGGWVAVGAPDMNGDGLADVVWFDAARNVMSAWLMAGTGVLARGPEITGPSGGGFVIPTLVDFNHDGLADVVWLDPATSRFAVWLIMNGTAVLSAGPVLAGPGSSGDSMR